MLDLTLNFDLEGMVKVTAHDPETGKQLEQIMDEEGNAISADLLKQKEWIDQLAINY